MRFIISFRLSTVPPLVSTLMFSWGFFLLINAAIAPPSGYQVPPTDEVESARNCCFCANACGPKAIWVRTPSPIAAVTDKNFLRVVFRMVYSCYVLARDSARPSTLQGCARKCKASKLPFISAVCRLHAFRNSSDPAPLNASFRSPGSRRRAAARPVSAHPGTVFARCPARTQRAPQVRHEHRPLPTPALSVGRSSHTADEHVQFCVAAPSFHDGRDGGRASPHASSRCLRHLRIGGTIRALAYADAFGCWNRAAATSPLQALRAMWPRRTTRAACGAPIEFAGHVPGASRSNCTGWPMRATVIAGIETIFLSNQVRG